MAGGNKNIKPEDGKQFSSEYQPENNGRKPSIRNQLKRLLEQDGKITIPSTQVYSLNEDGSVTLILPTQDQLAMKIMSWALGKKGTESLKALQMIMEQIDGKPDQRIEFPNGIQLTDPFAKMRENNEINI